MYRTDGSLVLSPTDLTRHQACPHATTLDLAVADGRLKPPLEGPTDHAALVAPPGTAHARRPRPASARAGPAAGSNPPRRGRPTMPRWSAASAASASCATSTGSRPGAAASCASP